MGSCSPADSDSMSHVWLTTRRPALTLAGTASLRRRLLAAGAALWSVPSTTTRTSPKGASDTVVLVWQAGHSIVLSNACAGCGGRIALPCRDVDCAG